MMYRASHHDTVLICNPIIVCFSVFCLLIPKWKVHEMSGSAIDPKETVSRADILSRDPRNG